MKYTSIFALTLLAAVPALAQNDLSWVSQRSGLDSNNCLLATPCKTFQGAYAKTNSGGIVRAIDAGEYGPVDIAKPIFIDGNGVGATIVATPALGYGVAVNTTGFVEIRNLAIHVPASCACFGIESESSGNNVSIEDVSITGAPSTGVLATGGTVTIHGLTVTGATSYGIYFQNATATISDSIIRYSDIGIALYGASAVTQALIERSKMISNSTGLVVGNGSAAATARISDCAITGNTTGISTTGGGQIVTFRNNTWAANATDGTTPFSVSLK
jgi:Right handed beta helix region